MTEEDGSFFERERERLIGEITAVSAYLNAACTLFEHLCGIFKGFEQLLPSTNSLNRKMEEVLGMTREYESIAELWHSFHVLMRNQRDDESVAEDQGAPQGLPGTGGHVLRQSNQEGTKQ